MSIEIFPFTHTYLMSKKINDYLLGHCHNVLKTYKYSSAKSHEKTFPTLIVEMTAYIFQRVDRL